MLMYSQTLVRVQNQLLLVSSYMYILSKQYVYIEDTIQSLHQCFMVFVGMANRLILQQIQGGWEVMELRLTKMPENFKTIIVAAGGVAFFIIELWEKLARRWIQQTTACIHFIFFTYIANIITIIIISPTIPDGMLHID